MKKNIEQIEIELGELRNYYIKLKNEHLRKRKDEHTLKITHNNVIFTYEKNILFITDKLLKIAEMTKDDVSIEEIEKFINSDELKELLEDK